MPDERLVKVIWAAGFLDGEACFMFDLKKKFNIGQRVANRTMAVNVAQVDIRPLLVLQDLWGGNINPRKASNERCADYFRWIALSSQAISLCIECVPYLVVKKEQAQIMIDYYATVHPRGGRGVHITDETVDLRNNLSTRLSALNKRGAQKGPTAPVIVGI